LNQEVYRHLTLREIEILSLVGRQASNQEIADELFLSLSTVKTHLRNIFRKLEVKSRSEAIKIMQNNCGQVSCNLPEKRIKTN
ncbi:MAG TPA: helix-turn-helix transcriptional regulator, partial [Syntrophomonadaceae bacterium]|nr:helix-turn-helix transcriptional regulator [Syntrophomonadaceae bacterium]